MNGDTISRSSVLRKLDSFHPDYTFNLASFKNLIKAEPTVEKKGKWIGEPSHPHCSECKVENYYAYKYDSYSGLYVQQDFYCPNCGSDMRGET